MNTPIKGMKVRRNTITGVYYIADAKGTARAQTASGTPLSEALAHQFAASGEMMEALEAILPIYKEWVDEGGHDPSVGIDASADFARIERAESALALAKGVS